MSQTKRGEQTELTCIVGVTIHIKGFWQDDSNTSRGRNKLGRRETDLSTRDEAAVKARHVNMGDGPKRRVRDGRLEVGAGRRRGAVLVVAHRGNLAVEGTWMADIGDRRRLGYCACGIEECRRESVVLGRRGEEAGVMRG